MTPERQTRIREVLARRQPDLTVVLENVQDPHNIAAVMRTCDAVGIQELYILNTPIPRHSKFGKSSSRGAIKWLTIHEFKEVDACVAAVREKYDRLYATHLGARSCSLYELLLTERVALVFGNEWFGVSEAMLQHCDGNFIIPQVGMVRSLNISVACAVTLYEALRQRTLAGHYNGNNRLPQDQYETLATAWGLDDTEEANGC